VLALYGGLYDGGGPATKKQGAQKKFANKQEIAAIQKTLDAARKAEAEAQKLAEEADDLAVIKAPGARAKKLEHAAKVREAQGLKQRAIAEAVSAYGIDVSKSKSVLYGADNTDGESETDDEGRVSIGDDAFKTPGWLASTIAHESEVHVNLQLRGGRNYEGNQGRSMNEVEAYDYEIRQAKRFGLTDEQVAGLRRSRSHYLDFLSPDNLKRRGRGDYSLEQGHEED